MRPDPFLIPWAVILMRRLWSPFYCFAAMHPYRAIAPQDREDLDDPFLLPMMLCRLFLLLLSFRRIGMCLQQDRWDTEGILAIALVVAIVALRVYAERRA